MKLNSILLSILLIGFGLLINGCGQSAENDTAADRAELASVHPQLDTVCPESCPCTGRWMLEPDSLPAHWLGVKWKGRILLEPINLLISDSLATSRTESRQALRDALSAAGFPSRSLHSGGYMGMIGDSIYPQLPDEKDHAFSNQFAAFGNIHGRVFGPRYINGVYWYTAAFSREKLSPFSKIKHAYDSFIRARDEVSKKLDQKGSFSISKTIDLQNKISGDSLFTTGDHDGRAILLTRQK